MVKLLLRITFQESGFLPFKLVQLRKNAGISGGDIITSMADLPLATNGTMSDYCDILRTHSADDTVNIEVVRFET